MSDYIKDAEARMEKCVDALKHNYAGVRTGRANPQVLDDFKV